MKIRSLTISVMMVVLVLGLFAAPAMAAGHDVYPPTPPVTPPPVTPPVTPPAPPAPPVPTPPVPTPPMAVTGVDALMLALAGSVLLGLGTVAVRGVKRPALQA
jgi:hypothetical protein